MNEQVFQIILLLFTGTISITGILLGFAVKAFLVAYKDDKANNINRMNHHSQRLDDHERRISASEQQLIANKEADAARMDYLKQSFSHIADDLKEIKTSQLKENEELRTLDRRLTDYIIGSAKPK